MKLILSLCLLLYAVSGILARFRNYADDADPIADEISEFLKESDGCNVIIAAEDKLEHMHQNDYVPVQIYSHSLCKANSKYCIDNERPKRLQRSPNCVRVLFTAEEKAEESPNPDITKQDDKYDVDDDEDADDKNGTPQSHLDKGFVSAVKSLAEEHTTEPMATKYFWMTPQSTQEPQPKTSLISTKWFKRWSFNLYQVVVFPDTRVSQYYFLCQFCTQHCRRMVPILVSRSEAASSVKNSNTFLSKVLQRRSWNLYKDFRMSQVNEYSTQIIAELKGMNMSNPFDVQSEDLALYIKYFAMKFILDETNSNLKGNESNCEMGTIYYRQTRKEDKWRPRDANYILGGVESFSYLTCHTTTKISFESYIVPFDIYTWIGILVSLAGMIVPIAVFERNYANAAQRLSLLEHLSVFVTTALNSCYPFPRVASQYVWYRVMAMAWFFAVLVLSNHYTSIAISDLTKSLPNQSISTFNDLVEFRACNPPSSPCKTEELKEHLSTEMPFPWEQKFKIYSTPVNEQNFGQVEWYFLKFGMKIRESLQKKIFLPPAEHRPEIDLSPSEISLLSLVKLHPESFIPKGLIDQGGWGDTDLTSFLSAIEEDLIECEYKVYADPTENIEAEYGYLSRHYHWLNFKVSEEKILFEEHYMGFQGDFGHTMSKTYRVLQESGILNHMKKYYREHLYRKRLNFTRTLKRKISDSTQDVDQPTKLSGSIQTVFYIYLALIGICYIVFGFEMQFELICYLLRKIIRGYNNLNVRAGFVKLLYWVGGQVVRLSLRGIAYCRDRVTWWRLRQNRVVELRPRRERQGRWAWG
jgi:hypothetical protein